MLPSRPQIRSIEIHRLQLAWLASHNRGHAGQVYEFGQFETHRNLIFASTSSAVDMLAPYRRVVEHAVARSSYFLPMPG